MVEKRLGFQPAPDSYRSTGLDSDDSSMTVQHDFLPSLMAAAPGIQIGDFFDERIAFFSGGYPAFV